MDLRSHRNAAVLAPSRTRWSIDRMSLTVDPTTTTPSRTTASPVAPPTARMAASAGLMTAVTWLTPNILRLLW
jgi:hypothetical protein